MKHLLYLLVILPCFSYAESLYLGGWSYHLNGGEHNETHNYIALEKDNWTIGTFENSHYDQTYIGTYSFSLYENSYLSSGVMTGMSYGYDPEDVNFLNYNGFMPIAVPYVDLKFNHLINPRIGLLGQAVFITFKIDY